MFSWQLFDVRYWSCCFPPFFVYHFEYLSIDVSDGLLRALPQLVDGYIPPLAALPSFVLHLAYRVDWTSEVACFEGLARQLAAFYRVARIECGEGPTSDGADGRAAEAGEAAAAGAVAGEAAEAVAETDLASEDAERVESACSSAWTIQHLLLPAIRRSYEPPSEQTSDGTVVQAACTEQLYRIFERC